MTRQASKVVATAVSLTALTAGTLVVRDATAQSDINPPLPNVVLVVDTSGSMEEMADGMLPKTCSENAGVTSDMNKWTTLIEVLTGTVKGRSCYKQDRSSSAFLKEYSLDGKAPYDEGYHLPYHRTVSNGCVAAPGQKPAKVYDWPNGAIRFHNHNDASTACNAWTQVDDGLLDVFRDRVRFGIMTFDPKTSKETGVNGTVYDAAGGFTGMWSYYDGWRAGGGGWQTGNPPNCASGIHEVGGRNEAAPPWEGRLISPGRTDASLNQVRDINDHVQESLLALRPYGATPLAGIMSDTYTFLRLDKSKDPLDPSVAFAPAGDPKIAGGCRKTYVILLSDGEPNLDLRPYCEEVGGKCPYKLPHEYAADLFKVANPNLVIQTYAIGFGLSSSGGNDCTKLVMPNDPKCVGATGTLKACCTLARIAHEGGTAKAYFADDVSTLKTTLSTVLSQIAGDATSRTLPVFSTATTTSATKGLAPAVAYQFTSSFNPGGAKLWTGNLERHRWVCKTKLGELVPELQKVESSKGDDFAKNINDGKAAIARRYISFIGNKSNISKKPGEIGSTWTIRPGLALNSDGFGVYSGTVVDGSIAVLKTTAKNNPAALGIDAVLPKTCKDANLKATTAGECAEKLMNWMLGGNNGGGLPTRSGVEFGAIYHATPAIVGAPNEHLRDADYEKFALANANRPLMLYSVTTDGQIHAHKVASNVAADPMLVDKLENNELWSFIPPFALPGLISTYPNTQKVLLDGTPIVKDVVFERSLGQAKAAGTGSGATWSTVMVVGGGSGGGFYVALDVTDPTKPKFLWQISSAVRNGKNDDTNLKLFADTSGTPTITTLAIKDGANVKETAVAILPGGASTPISGGCINTRKAATNSHVDPKYPPRNSVRCWKAGPGRSLSIVRLSDGEILRTFTRDAVDVPADIKASLVSKVNIDSPFTGTPVAYPSATGQVANRLYLGDADGAMWRFDLSDPDPAKWTTHIAFDAYPLKSDGYDSGENVATHPAVAVDGVGNTVLVFATGDQEMLSTTTGMKTRVWSVTEVPDPLSKAPNPRFTVKANWLLPFADGKRATGPITIFDGAAYFTTFTPESGGLNPCADGYGSLYGVHYQQSTLTVNGPTPLPRLVKDPDAKILVYIDELKQDPGTVVFGASVQMEPSCFETATTTDDYTGAHTAITNSSPPKFNLVYHTGKAGSNYNDGAKTKATATRLPSPKGLLRFDSWASVSE
ncbi:MAG: hypothetical protein EXR75_03800 [Myxococcales bacterium]|nr:hypothetical protein [Myxococcales bacterium]